MDASHLRIPWTQLLPGRPARHGLIVVRHVPTVQAALQMTLVGIALAERAEGIKTACGRVQLPIPPETRTHLLRHHICVLRMGVRRADNWSHRSGGDGMTKFEHVDGGGRHDSERSAAVRSKKSSPWETGFCNRKVPCTQDLYIQAPRRHRSTPNQWTIAR